MSYYVEIHSVAITLREDNIEGREIFGVVEARDCEGSVEIYNESKKSCKPVLENGILHLTGPSRPIKAPIFGIYVNLKDKRTDFEVGYGYYIMREYPPSSWYNKPTSIIFQGKHGKVRVYATMFSNALAITLQVSLIDTEGPHSKKAKITGEGDDLKSPRSIHGTLYARLSGQERVHYQRTLFSRSANDAQILVDGDVIPLSRSIFVLPRYAIFDIVADLWEETEGARAQVVKDTVSFDDTNLDIFRPETMETEKLGGIEVQVTWRE